MVKEIDPTQRLKLHMRYSRKRDHWARSAIELLAEGNDKQGMAAVELAEYWDLKAKSLGPRM